MGGGLVIYIIAQGKASIDLLEACSKVSGGPISSSFGKGGRLRCSSVVMLPWLELIGMVG